MNNNRHLQVVNEAYLAQQAAQAEAAKPVFIDKVPQALMPSHVGRLKAAPEMIDGVPFDAASRRADPQPIGREVVEVITHVPTAEELAAAPQSTQEEAK